MKNKTRTGKTNNRLSEVGKPTVERIRDKEEQPGGPQNLARFQYKKFKNSHNHNPNINPSKDIIKLIQTQVKKSISDTSARPSAIIL